MNEQLTRTTGGNNKTTILKLRPLTSQDIPLKKEIENTKTKNKRRTISTEYTETFDK